VQILQELCNKPATELSTSPVGAATLPYESQHVHNHRIVSFKAMTSWQARITTSQAVCLLL